MTGHQQVEHAAEVQFTHQVSSEVLAADERHHDPADGGDEGDGVLIVDDLTDTGKTAALVRSMLPKAHFATVYAKPKGRPLVDTFITEVSQDTWIFFPWDMGLTFQAPISKGVAG